MILGAITWNEIIYFSLFLVLIFAILLFDLGIFYKNDHEVGFTEALIWSVFWVALSLSFYFFIIHFGYTIHGIENLDELKHRIARFKHPIDIDGLSFPDAILVYEKNLGLEYLTGYLIEKTLSVDNIFVIILIFYGFGVDKKYYKRILLWGIIGAIFTRFIFIFTGAALVRQFDWLLYIFGIFLIFTGLKLFWERHKAEEVETENHPVVRFLSRHFRVSKKTFGHRFFVKLNGKWFITPLLVVLVVIEFSDVVFAVDSIPAIFAVSKDPLIIFFSNIFAILGLRAMFFLLANILPRFCYLKTGLAVLLSFIGIKMLIPEFLLHIGFTNLHSLWVILAILTVSVLASMIFPPKK